MGKICVIGNDNRSNYIRKLYKEEGVRLYDYLEAEYIIAPIPFTRDGITLTGEVIKCDEFLESIKGKVLFSGAFKEDIKDKLQDIEYYDLMDMDDVAILNAIPTAEGAIVNAMENSDTTIHGSNCLVMGYGRIGKILSKMLQGIGANVYCEARKKKDLVYISAMGYESIDLTILDKSLPKMDYIFNTIPVKLLTKERLNLLKKDCLVIDLASNPGGVDFEDAKKLGIDVIWALSLPSKVAPKTAAIYLKETIDRIMQEL